MHLKNLLPSHVARKSLFLVLLLLCLPGRVFPQNEWSAINGCALERKSKGSKITSIVFLDERHGVLGGDGGLLRYTQNGGVTWRQPEDIALNPPQRFTDDIQRIAVSKDKLVLISYNQIMVSRDAGVHWMRVGVPPPQAYNQAFGVTTTGFFYDASFSGEDGWVLGAAYDIKGKNFLGSFFFRLKLNVDHQDSMVKKIVGRDPSTELLQIFFTDSKRGWTVGTKGEILHTKNGGADWEVQNNTPYFRAPEPAEGRTVTPNQITAQTPARPPIPKLYGVYFIDKERGWVVGDNSTILYTQDGGETWDAGELNSPIQGIKNPVFNQVQFLNSDVGWIVGTGGIILKTFDGGQRWATQMMGAQTLYAIDMNGEEYGWAGGAGDTLLRFDAIQPPKASKEERARRFKR